MAEKKKKPFKGYNKKKHSRTGGLNDKERARINREEGSNLKRPVTGKVKAGSKAANRRKSFCARMSGVKGPTSKDGQLTPKGAALKRWKCRKSLQKSDMPPKAKLAAFLRDHIDNKLALKAAEPTITKSDEKAGMSALMKALKDCACKKSDKLPGGKGDTKDISDFNTKEVEMGLKVEMEHTKDREVAQEIVADHLSEDPSYYSKLKGSGLADELKKAGRCWEGYEPTPGKKPYSKGSCRKIQKSISAEAIEAGQYQGEKLDSHHHNRLGNEYKGMAQKAHKMGDKKKAREYHDKALHHFKMADKMGFQEEEPLEKKISGKVAAGLTALSGIVSSPTATTANKPPQIEAPKPIIPQEKYFDLKNELSAQTIQNMFLHNISQLESSGGKNKNHPVIKDPKSIHYGMKAVGNFAMMPLTIQEIANRHAHNGGKDPKILKIQKMNPHTGEINKYIEANPELEMDLARNLATHVLNKHGYTPEAAFSWKYGHNLSPQQIKEPDRQEKMKSDTYVQEFKQLQQGGSPKGLVPAINRNIN